MTTTTLLNLDPQSDECGQQWIGPIDAMNVLANKLSRCGSIGAEGVESAGDHYEVVRSGHLIEFYAPSHVRRDPDQTDEDRRQIRDDVLNSLANDDNA